MTSRNEAVRLLRALVDGPARMHCGTGVGPQWHATEEGCNFTKRGPECDCNRRWAEARRYLATLTKDRPTP